MKNLQSRTKVRLLQSFLLISLSLFFLVNPAYAQGGFAVKGVIVDKTGFPLPGANVMEKGTSNGTITDLDGNFSLNVSKKGVTLTVSFMGYTPKDVVVKDKTMNITLEENSKLLDEVVVVGYGTMKKRDVTGAITSISSEAIEQKMQRFRHEIIVRGGNFIHHDRCAYCPMHQLAGINQVDNAYTCHYRSAVGH